MAQLYDKLTVRILFRLIGGGGVVFRLLLVLCSTVILGLFFALLIAMAYLPKPYEQAPTFSIAPAQIGTASGSAVETEGSSEHEANDSDLGQ